MIVNGAFEAVWARHFDGEIVMREKWIELKFGSIYCTVPQF